MKFEPIGNKREDHHLVMIDSDEARTELQETIERRQRHKMQPLLIIRTKHLERAPETTLVMLADLGVAMADDEIERRRLAGERIAA